MSSKDVEERCSLLQRHLGCLIVIDVKDDLSVGRPIKHVDIRHDSLPKLMFAGTDRWFRNALNLYKL